MSRLSLVILLMASVWIFQGCNNPMGDGMGGSLIDTGYHPGLPEPTPTPTPTSISTSLPFGAVGGFKITPGAVSASGSNTAAAVSVTLTNRKLSGSGVSGRVSISKYHPLPQ